MARINLLPWREVLAKEKKRQFLMIAGLSVVLAVSALAFVHINISQRISDQIGRNKFLDTKIEEVDRQIKEIQSLEADKQNLLARMKIIQTLQSSRPEIVHLFQEVAQTMPEGVYLTQLNVTSKLIKVEGVAESNANVSALMRNIDSTTRMTLPLLDVIDSSKSDYPGMSWFAMRVTPNHPGSEPEPEAPVEEKPAAGKPAGKAPANAKAAPAAPAKEAKK